MAAGERNLGPRIEEIEAGLAALSELREKPSGTATISITQAGANPLPPLRL
jgi:hypothetical protein